MQSESLPLGAQASEADLYQERRVSARTTKGKVSGRYNPSLYAITILFLIALMLSAVGASSVPPWSSGQAETPPIIDGHILWHPWERVILLSKYQFLIVSYKVLPPKTSAGKYLCGELYNETEVTAPSWYIEWEKEIDNLTKRSLKISEINSTKSINLHRSRRSTEESVRLEAVRSATVIPKFSLTELNSRVMLNISAEAIIHNTSTPRNPFQVLVHRVEEKPNNLASHNQEMVSSNRINAALLLCKQRLLQ